MDVTVLLAPYDSGRFRERMGCGPEHLMERCVKPLLTRLGHPFRAETITVPDAFTAEIRTAFVLNGLMAERVRAVRAEGRFPLVLSGNCNTAVGTISGCGWDDTDVVWFDAHGEATTPETTRSGFLDGMPISILTGQCWQNLAHTIPGFEPLPGGRIVLVGSRDLETAEAELLDRVGVRRVAALDDVGDSGVYLHLDLDVLDPVEALWNQWPTPGGLKVAEISNAVSEMRRRTTIKAAGVASYDPACDRDGRAIRAATVILQSIFETT
jgi:arginase